MPDGQQVQFDPNQAYADAPVQGQPPAAQPSKASSLVISGTPPFDPNQSYSDAPSQATQAAQATPAESQDGSKSWWSTEISEPLKAQARRMRDAVLANEGPGWMPYDLYHKFVPDETDKPVTPATDQEATDRLKARNASTAPDQIQIEKQMIDRIRQNQPYERRNAKEYAEGGTRLISPEKLMTKEEKQNHPVMYGLLRSAGQLSTEDNLMIMAGSQGLGFFGEAAAASPSLGMMANVVSKAPRIVSAYFAGQMGKGVVEQIPGLIDAKKQYDAALQAGDEKKAQEILWNAKEQTAEVASQAYMAYAAAYHAGTGHPDPVGKAVADAAKDTTKYAAEKGVEAGRTAIQTAGQAARSVAETAGAARSWTSEKLGAALGKTSDFKTAVMRASQVSPKQYADHKEKIESVKEDLQAIFNANKDKIVDPKTAAQAIDDHLQNKINNKLLEEAKSTKDDATPVTPDLEERLRNRLDKFFDDNKGKYGSTSEVENAKEDLVDRVMQPDRTVPNLFETENIRRGLNVESSPMYAPGAKSTSNAYKAGAMEVGGLLREVLDQTYSDRGVKNVAQARQKEADLIDVRDRLLGAQAKAEKMGNGGVFDNLMKKIGVPSTVIAIALGHPIGAAAIGSAVLGEHITQNITNPNVNIGRAVDIAGKNPEAQATVPEFTGQPVPTPEAAPVTSAAAPAVQEPITSAAQPEAKSPPVNHKLYSALSSYFGKIVGTIPYDQLVDKFEAEIHDAALKGAINPQQQKLLEKFNDARAAHRETTEKEAQDRLSEHREGLLDSIKKFNEERQKAAEAQRKAQEEAEKEKAEKAANNLVTATHAPFETEEHLPVPARYVKLGYTPQRVGVHELAHQIMADEFGHATGDIINHNHDDIDSGALAEARWDKTQFMKEGKVDPAKLPELLAILHAGPVAEEIVHGVPMHKNPSNDIEVARQIAKDAGLNPTEVGMLMKAAEMQARQILTTPGVSDILKRYSESRQKGLKEDLHMHAETVGQAVQEVRHARGRTNGPNNEKPAGKTAKGVDKGNGAGGKGEAAPKPEGTVRASGKTGASSGEPRTNITATQGGHAGGGVASEEELARPGYFVKVSRSGEATHQGKTPDFLSLRAGEAGYQVKPDGTFELKAGQETPATKRGVEGYARDVFGTKTKSAPKTNIAVAEAPETVDEHADEFNRLAGRPEVNAENVPHVPATAERIAQAYETMSHNPNDPAVKKAYNAAKNDIDDQWDYATDKMGIKFEPWTKEGQPYANSKEMVADVKGNKHLYFFQGGELPADHPLAQVDSKTGLSYNDKLRAVHDLFGHAAHEFQFGPKGEENAWNVHRQMFSPEAVPAITTETRGQNSWVNYGRHLRVPFQEGRSIPPERTAGEHDAAIKQGGGVPGGIQTGDPEIDLPDLALFHDPTTGSTLALKAGEVTPEAVREQIQKSRAAYLSAKPEQSRIPEKGQPGYISPTERPYAQNKAGILPAEFHKPNTSGGEIKTNIAVAEPETISDRLVDTFGTTDKSHDAGFILSDGRMVPLHGEHNTMMDTLYNKYGDIPQADAERTTFINNEKAVRTRYRQTRGGNEVAFSVPKSGVTPEQIEQIKKSVGQLRNGNVVMEISEGDGKSTKKEFARVSDVEPMLREIGAHPEGAKIAPEKKGDWAKGLADQIASGDEKFLAGGIDPEDGSQDSRRYGYEVYPEARTVLDQSPTAKQLRAFARVNEDVLSEHPDFKLGWEKRPDGKFELNIGASTDDLDTATAAAKKLDQRAIWDNEAQKVIETGGTGEKTKFSGYPLHKRISELSAAPKSEDTEFSFGANAPEQTADQEKGLISTRLPEGRAATENPLKEDLKIGRDAIDRVPGLPEKMAARIKDYPGIKIPANLKDPGKIMDRFVDHLKGNLVDLYNQVPEERRQANSKWYDSANKLAQGLADKYNSTLQQVAGTIAAMSPQKDWDQNVSLAKRVSDAYHTQQDTTTTPEMLERGLGLLEKVKSLAGILPAIEGKKLSEITDPIERAAWIRLHDETTNPREYQKIDPGTGEEVGVVNTDKGRPRKVAWGSLSEISKAISILENGDRDNISQTLGDAHKVRNFYNNILDPNNPAGHVTIDTHAVAAAHQQPFSGKSTEVLNNFKGVGSKSTGVKGTYALYADAYRQAAQELNIQPRQLQSVVWEEIRRMFPDDFKRAGAKVEGEGGAHQNFIKNLWEQYADGKLSLDKTRKAVRQYAKEEVDKLEAKKPLASKQTRIDWEKAVLPSKFVQFGFEGR